MFSEFRMMFRTRGWVFGELTDRL